MYKRNGSVNKRTDQICDEYDKFERIYGHNWAPISKEPIQAMKWVPKIHYNESANSDFQIVDKNGKKLYLHKLKCKTGFF